MRLKSLEIKGFKSFADDTVIHFGNDVIGIVGPNGSGKSNIVDAIRWVLGEQSSKELRLDQMSNVIFNGTRKRRPAPYAQVTLAFENTRNILPLEYQNIAISRLLYQNGESEYRLNNVTCRLKDITNLFLDTGIGSHSYAIIALSMVDDILDDKDNSRLQMLEQAAGVSKYKLRKRETLSKLKSTTEDLDRAEDLLFEIESNLKTLEQQARKTKRYFDLKQEYRDAYLLLAGIQHQKLKEKYDRIHTQIEQEEDRFREIEVATTLLESKLEAERKANLDKEKLLSERQRELNTLVNDIRQLENDRNMLQQRKDFIGINRQKLSQQIDSHQHRIIELETSVSAYQADLTEEKRLESDLESQLRLAEQNLNSTRQSHGVAKADLDDILKGQQQFERELFELEKRKAVNANRIDNLQAEQNRNETAAFERKLELENLKKKIEETTQRETAAKSALDLLLKEAGKRQDEIKRNEKLSEEIQQQLSSLNRDLDSKRNEFQLTRSMVDSLEGFPESIRFLSTNKDWSKSAPLLSDVIYVQEEYRVAIENYLEPYLNYYVTHTYEEAFKAVRLLSQSQKGKANFFVLEAFRQYQAPMFLLPGTVSALELVTVDPMYRNLCGYLLENVLLTDDEDIAQAPTNQDYVLLSKNGHFVKRKFSVSGGSVGLFEGKRIGRKKNLEILETAIAKIEKEAFHTNQQLQNLKSGIELLRSAHDERKIQQSRDFVNQTSQEVLTLQHRHDLLSQQWHEYLDRHKIIGEEMKSLQKINAEIDFSLDDKTRFILDVKGKIAQIDQSYRIISDQLSQASAGYNERNIAYIRQQNKTATLQRELSFRENQLREIRASLDVEQKALFTSAEELQQVIADAESTELRLQSSYDMLKEKESHLSDAEQLYYQARGGIIEIEDEVRKLSKSRNDSQILVNSLKDKLTDVRVDMSSLAERLRVEFSTTIDQASHQPATVTPDGETELQLKVEKLRNRLDNFGEINPLAVEAYDTMKERYDAITDQRDDILRAKEDLLRTIEEIETTATAQFLDSFERVRASFIEVFRNLFTDDDTADLLLLDPQNPLESKIEIIAKPKGKRPQTISQLSGGEKTLTATAFLFSLYLLKPAPFCIFDEVDAPLDDSNIEKFNRIIKRFSSESQFIIVTHNKLTMAAVDVIYGVYMQEQGISAVTPVDFRAFEHKSLLEAINP